MLKLISASSEHAEQLLHYFSITCYWREFVENNKLGKSYEDFMLEYIILPRIPITQVWVKPNDTSKIYGCLIAASVDEFSQMPDYTPYLDSNIIEIFKKWFLYPVNDGVVLELYAIDPELKGCGYGKLMLDEVDKLALKQNKDTISCFVWTCFHDSIITTTKHHYTIVDCIKFPNLIDMGLLYMEKNNTLLNKVDYFISDNYNKKTMNIFS